ncbi:MAG: amidase [Candidatus Rokuibacteriota bacterium]
MRRPDANSDDPCELPARVLARRLRQRQLSAAEVLKAHLARIEKHNTTLTAVVSLDVERARKLARKADAALRRGEVWGPLHGIPMTLKDGHDVAGLRTTVGTKELDRVAEEDGTVAARLRVAGAIIIGHTNVPPWLADYQTANQIFGRTANPWDVERTAGGSSGGAAAALAAGMTPLEIGSDLVVSIRLPAHFCGVYGLKPTEHRVPLTGFLRLPGVPRSVRIMSCLGPMARDLGDLELALSIIAGPDGHDSDVPPVPLATEPRRRLSGLHLAVATTLPGATVATSLRRQVERVAAEAARAGARVEERLPDIDWDESNQLFGELVATITGREEGRLSRYFGALALRDRFIAGWRAFFENFDALILPPAATSAFTHRKSGERIEVDGKTVSYEALGLLGAFANLTGLPALVAPAAIDNGLPIGIQLVGPRWSEMRLLRIARQLEQVGVLPGFQEPPSMLHRPPGDHRDQQVKEKRDERDEQPRAGGRPRRRDARRAGAGSGPVRRRPG